jgi:hypothetical protein
MAMAAPAAAGTEGAAMSTATLDHPDLVAAVPPELRDRPQWIVWRLEVIRGHRRKVPY